MPLSPAIVFRAAPRERCTPTPYALRALQVRGQHAEHINACRCRRQLGGHCLLVHEARLRAARSCLVHRKSRILASLGDSVENFFACGGLGCNVTVHGCKLLDADRCSAWCGRHLASPPPPARRHRRRHCYRRPLQPAMPCAVATVAIPDLASHRCLGCLLQAAARGSGARERPERAARGSGARQRHEAEARGSFTVPEVRVGVLARAPFFK